MTWYTVSGYLADELVLIPRAFFLRSPEKAPVKDFFNVRFSSVDFRFQGRWKGNFASSSQDKANCATSAGMLLAESQREDLTWHRAPRLASKSIWPLSVMDQRLQSRSRAKQANLICLTA